MEYKYLDRWRGSGYRQFFYTERKIRAETLYRATVGPEPRTPEEVACDFDVPLEAVYEAIHYCTHNEDLLNEERERDIAEMRAMGIIKTPPVPTNATDGS